MSDSPEDSRSARIRLAMAADDRVGVPVPSVSHTQSTVFPLGFAPPPTGDDLLESLGPILNDADVAIEGLQGDIDGLLNRERSVAETGLLGMVEVIRRPLVAEVAEIADGLAGMTRLVEDVAFDELGMIAEDAATVLGLGDIQVSFPEPVDIPQEVSPPFPEPVPPDRPGPSACQLAGYDPDGPGRGMCLGNFPFPPVSEQCFTVADGPFVVELPGGAGFEQIDYLVIRVPDAPPPAGGPGMAIPASSQQDAAGFASGWFAGDVFGDDPRWYHANLVTTSGVSQRVTLGVWVWGEPPEQQIVPLTCTCPPGFDCPWGGTVPTPIPLPPGGPTFPPEGEPCPEPEECEPTECFLWMAHETCEIYALPVGEDPRSRLDRRLGKSIPADRIQALLDELCGLGTEEEERHQHPTPEEFNGDSIRACQQLPAALALGIQGISDLPGFIDSLFARFQRTPSALSLEDPLTSIIHNLIDGLRNAISGSIGAGDSLLESVFAAMGCASPTHLGVRAAATIVGFLRTWLGDGFADALVPLLQQARFMCPGSVPSAQEATMAFLANSIDRPTWACWVRANNMIDSDFDKVTRAARSKLGVADVVSLRARGLLSAQGFANHIRELGFIDSDEPEQFWRISEQIPGMGDLVRFMVRDAADDDVARDFGYDQFFDDKFTGRVKEWAEQARIPEDYMKMAWRSHWQIPSPTQLGEMRRRLSHLSRSDPAFVDDAMVRTALQVQDIAPGWIDQFMAIMFRPLTRVDARRLLERGVITRAETVFAWTQLGYDQQNADRLVSLAEKIAGARAAKHPGVRRYAQGELNQTQLEAMLQQDGIGESFFPIALARGQLEARAGRQKRCVASIRKRFMLGELDVAELNAQLTAQNLDNNQVGELAEGMVCERDTRGRLASGSTLCQWFHEGIIDTVDFFNRLRNLKWGQDDATRFIQHCQIQLVRKQTAEEQKRMRAAVKRSKEALAEQKKLERALETERKKAATELKRAADTAKRHRQILLDIASNMAKRMDVQLVNSKRATNVVFQSIQADALATREQTLQLMKEASESPDADGFDSLERMTLELIDRVIFPTPL